MCVFIGNILVDFIIIINGHSTVYCVVNFPENCIGLIGSVCVHIRRSYLCLSHVYMDLYCGECYYSCL